MNPESKTSETSAFVGSEVRLVELERDHPGFSDPVYRRRRDQIAQHAHDYVSGGPIVSVDYLPGEQTIWTNVWTKLETLHRRWACAQYLEGLEYFTFTGDHIPSFGDVNRRLEPLQGFSLAPVAGLVMPSTFLEQLGQRRFLATQYIRHHSRPLYTPEPDVIHEYVGHVPTLAHPRFARLNEAFGRACLRAEESEGPRVEALIRVYWYTLEFGAVWEGDQLKAYGAGILSSFGELERFATEARRMPWDLEAMSVADYDPTDYQAEIYVAPSFDTMERDLLAWLEA